MFIINILLYCTIIFRDYGLRFFQRYMVAFLKEMWQKGRRVLIGIVCLAKYSNFQFPARTQFQKCD